jgi:RNA polymerase sigma-70 factor (ECF subfamily)
MEKAYGNVVVSEKLLPEPYSRASFPVRQWQAPMRRTVPSTAELRIAAGLRRRDPDAVRTLSAEYGAPTLALLRSTLSDRCAAEDVYQQVLLEAWQRSPSYDPARASLRTWLATIARSRAIDELRRRVPEPYDPQLDEQVHASEPEDDAIERLTVDAALRRLPSEEAEVLWLGYRLGLSQRQIAQHTGVPLGTVKSRSASALRRLRAMIEEERAPL